MADFKIIKADLDDSIHHEAILTLMDAYSSDPMGDNKPLSQYTRDHLIQGLREHPTTIVFLAFKDLEAVGIATCFKGFSTFQARPLLNISDFFVYPSLRGLKIGRKLLEAIESEAISLECCKLTLEVQHNNSRAQSIYNQFGFAQAVYAADVDGGGSIYMTKSI